MPEMYNVTRHYWALLWRSHNKLDGYREHVMFKNCRPLLFDTRREVLEYREKEYGYIRNRPDLKAEPHGWRIPLPIKVKMKFEWLCTRSPICTKSNGSARNVTLPTVGQNSSDLWSLVIAFPPCLLPSNPAGVSFVRPCGKNLSELGGTRL